MVGCHGSRAQARTQRSYWNRINLREAKSAFFRDKSYRCQRGGEKKKKRYKSAVFARGSLHFHWDRSVSVFHFFPLPSLPSRAAIVQNDKDHSQYTRSPIQLKKNLYKFEFHPRQRSKVDTIFYFL